MMFKLVDFSSPDTAPSHVSSCTSLSNLRCEVAVKREEGEDGARDLLYTSKLLYLSEKS
jgi:hypothetical protein